MENLSIQHIWEQNEKALEKTRKLNLSLLREIKLDKARSSVKKLLFLPISTLIFYSILGGYALYFTATQWGIWYFMLAGGAVAYFSIWFALSSIRQLKIILSLDYETPVIRLQEDLAHLKVAIVHNLRIGAWSLPFGPFVGLFFFKALFDVDLMGLLNYTMIVSFGIVTIVLEIISLLLLRALRPKNINKKWLNWLLQGSGSQVTEAMGFLDQIMEFQVEEEVKWE